jgi:DnaK suppressor protein
MAARPAKKEVKTTTPRGKKGATSTGTASNKSAKDKPEDRHAALKEILLAKREALIKEIKQQLGQSVTDEQSRRLEAAMDSGDQALVDLDREMGISLQEMRNRERQLIDDALDSLDEGTYGVCAECEGEISEKRLEALPFARLCVARKTKRELMEKIERSEQRQ